MWAVELCWLGVPPLAGAVGAWSLGWSSSAGLAAGLAVCALRALRQLAALNRWLGIEGRRSGAGGLPPASGLWQAVFERLGRWRRDDATEEQPDALHWRRFVDGWEDGWIEVDAERCVRYCNPAAQRILALGGPPELGASLFRYFRAPEFVAAMESAAGQAPHVSLDIDDYPSMRSRLRCRILDFGARRAVLVRDLTGERRRQRMQEDFVANVSHELCTPLSVIVGRLELLAADLGADGDRRLEPVSAQLAKIQKLVDTLTGMSALSDSKEAAWEEVDVAELLAAAWAGLASLAGPGRRIDIECERGLALLGERGALESAVGNLLANAIRFTDPDGRIELRAARGPDGGARIAVRDDGIGIAAEHLPRLTERFYRADPSRDGRSGGFGLGLSIVQHALDKHQARLEVDSALGEGSAFSCRFPAARVAGSAAARERA